MSRVDCHFLVSGLFTLTWLSVVDTAHVLMVSQNVNSHISSMAHAARALVDEGHRVDFLFASNAKVPPQLQHASIKTITYEVRTETPFMNTREASEMMLSSGLSETLTQRVSKMIELRQSVIRHWEEDCIAMLKSGKVKSHVNSRSYDVAIVDEASLDCQAVLPYSLGLKILVFGLFYDPWEYRVPALTSFVPCKLTLFSDKMNFWERTQNTMACFIFLVLRPKHNQLVFETYSRPKPPTTPLDILRNASMYFVQYDDVLSYPRPAMPNVVQVGDIIPQPPKDLPADIKTFVENSTNGVIVVSFGSYFDYLPEDIAAKFCNAFSRVPFDVIWKLKNKSLCPAGDKTLLIDWLPQNDLLAHPKVQLFVSHCGANSVLESIYHGTPVLAAPISIDQPVNAIALERNDLGLQIALNDFTEDELVTKILRIMESNSIKQNVRKASSLMKDKPMPPGKRISYWVNHVVAYGDEHMRSGAVDLTIIEFLMLDIFLAVFVSVLVLLLVMVGMSVCCLKCLRRRCCPSRISKQKNE